MNFMILLLMKFILHHQLNFTLIHSSIHLHLIFHYFHFINQKFHFQLFLLKNLYYILEIKCMLIGILLS